MADDPPGATADADPGDERAEASDEQYETLEELIEGLLSGQIVHAGVKLGIFEFVDDEPVAASAVAGELDLDPEYSFRLLRALAHLELLEAHDDRRFSLTDLGAFFEADHPDSWVTSVSFHHSPEFVTTKVHLPDVVREGGPSGFVREYGHNSFEYAERNPEFAGIFNRAMTEGSQETTPKILEALEGYDFQRLSHVCDVGGGYGHTLCHLLDAHPHLEGTVLDLPNVVEETGEHWASRLGVEDRCAYVAGDMFESVPRADAYVLKFVLHDWTDEDCLEVLSTIHDAAPPDARVFVVETLMADLESPDPKAVGDIAMMVHHDGRERTEAEYRSLLEREGWEFVRTWTSDGEDEVSRTLGVVEATKV